MSATDIDLMTVEEVAVYLQFQTKTIRNLTRRGDLPGFNVGSRRLRFRKAELGSWLESRKRPVSENGGQK